MELGTLSVQERQLMIQWAQAYVERGKIDLQVSYDTTKLVAKIQESMNPDKGEEVEANGTTD